MLATLPKVTVLKGWRLTSAKVESGAVTAIDIVNRKSGESRQIEATLSSTPRTKAIYLRLPVRSSDLGASRAMSLVSRTRALSISIIKQMSFFRAPRGRRMIACLRTPTAFALRKTPQTHNV